MKQNKSKFMRIILIIYSILSISSTLYLLMRPADTEIKNRYQETKQELKQIRNYIKQRDAFHDRIVDSFKVKSDSLEAVIHVTDKRLNYSRSQVIFLSNQVNDYVDAFVRDTSLKKNANAFDSLSGLSKTYILASYVRDSLCDNEINTLKQLVEIKNSIIQTNDSLLSDYENTLEYLMSSSLDLNDKLHLAEKKLKRRKIFNRVLGVGVVFTSGVLISNFLKPH